MTAQELIEYLNRVPGNTLVTVFNEGFGTYENVKEIAFQHDLENDLQEFRIG